MLLLQIGNFMAAVFPLLVLIAVSLLLFILWLFWVVYRRKNKE